MQFSEAWLREWVDPELDTNALAQKLTLAGLEVDSISPAVPEFTNVVVGLVKSKQRHPNADRLSVCEVDVGEEKLTIVCGASNVRENLKVPVAKIGAILPGDFKIKKSKLRDVTSSGMICSASELGLAESSAGIMELPEDAPIAADIRDYLNLDDHIIDIDLTPNRGDCASILGIAREVSALTGTPFSAVGSLAIKPRIKDQLKLTLTADKACPRYLGRVIRGINANTKTPLWLQEKLRRSGIRSLHPVVDVTNYVMMELGQPLHAFDLSMISNAIDVRFAKPGEQLTLLDGTELTLDKDCLTICNQDKALALAGIMGGAESAVTGVSTDIFLESAFFDPVTINLTTQRLGIRSDSSYRFERGVDFELQQQGIERATELLLDIVGGEAGPVSVVEAELPQREPISLRRNRIARVLGIEISDEQISQILTQLGIDLTPSDDGWLAVVPSYRFDISLEVDLIEEVARCYGYEQIPAKVPQVTLNTLPSSDEVVNETDIRRVLQSLGYSEAITYSFVDPDIEKMINPQGQLLTLSNPISSEMSVMRSTSWTGLLQAYLHNRDRQQTDLRLYEVGLSFYQHEKSCDQVKRLAGLVSGHVRPEQWGDPSRKIDFFDVKQHLLMLFGLTRDAEGFVFEAGEHPALHPGQTAKILRNQLHLGCVGALHPKIAQQLKIKEPIYLFDLDFESIIKALLPKYQPLSKYPAIRRDIAIIIDDNVPVTQVENLMQQHGRGLLQQLQIFDIYAGDGVPEGRKSVAVGMVFQHQDRTLVDDEVNTAVNHIVNALTQELNAILRD